MCPSKRCPARRTSTSTFSPRLAASSACVTFTRSMATVSAAEGAGAAAGSWTAALVISQAAHTLQAVRLTSADA